MTECFIQALCDSLKPLSPEAWEQYRRWCVHEAEARVQAVVGGQHRGSYDKASALVVSIAEAMLARGDARGTAEFLIEYKEKYPRHTAFHMCLREDVKRSTLNISL